MKNFFMSLALACFVFNCQAATKPNLNTNLGKLKTSLSQLKFKLTKLRTKLGELKGQLSGGNKEDNANRDIEFARAFSEFLKKVPERDFSKVSSKDKNDLVEKARDLLFYEGYDKYKIINIDDDESCDLFSISLFLFEHFDNNEFFIKLLEDGFNVNQSSEESGVNAIESLFENLEILKVQKSKILETFIMHAKNPDFNISVEFMKETPLHIAVKNNLKNIVQLLLEKGAKKEAKNSEGKTPLDIAKALGRTDIINLLKENK